MTGIGCKPDAPRASDELDLTTGLVVQDVEGRDWVFIGHRSNTVGLYPVFVRVQTGDRDHDGWAGQLHVYKAAITETVVRKFPALAQRRRDQ